jgi:hypothetical protein
MSLDIILMGAAFLFLAVIGCFSKRRRERSYALLLLLMGGGGLLIMACGMWE